jgi:hypothetical protein
MTGEFESDERDENYLKEEIYDEDEVEGNELLSADLDMEWEEREGGKGGDENKPAVIEFFFEDEELGYSINTPLADSNRKIMALLTSTVKAEEEFDQWWGVED